MDLFLSCGPNQRELEGEWECARGLMALAPNRVQVLRRFRPGLAPPEEGSGRVWGFRAKPRQWRWQASSGV